MGFKATFSQEALDDIDNIIDAIDSSTRRKQLEQFAKSAPITYKNVRVALFFKTPFKNVYTLTQSILYIIAIWHQKRLDDWKDRVDN